MSNQTDFLLFSDEQESVQKRTFTKWINTHLAKVIHGFETYFFKKSNLLIYAYTAREYKICQISLSSIL